MEPDNFQQIQVERNEVGQFVSGQSGNPAGRPPGSRNHATMLAEQLLDGASGALTNKAVQLALAGNVAALRLTLSCIIAPRRHRATAFSLPPLNAAVDCAPAMTAVAAAVSEGAISAEEAAAFSQVVDTFLRALEAGELEARLQRLERANGIAAQ